MFSNCCAKLMLNHFFFQSIYGKRNDTCNSTSETRASCSFLLHITNIDNYTIQVEAQNADGIIESDITHWRLDDISKCYFIFLRTLSLKDNPTHLFKEIPVNSKVDSKLKDIVCECYG